MAIESRDDALNCRRVVRDINRLLSLRAWLCRLKLVLAFGLLALPVLVAGRYGLDKDIYLHALELLGSGLVVLLYVLPSRSDAVVRPRDLRNLSPKAREEIAKIFDAQPDQLLRFGALKQCHAALSDQLRAYRLQERTAQTRTAQRLAVGA